MHRPKGYRVPSWSWAAVDGLIRFEKHRDPTSGYLELIDCTITQVSEDAPYGAVTSGLLTLRGRLREVLWNEARDSLIDPSSNQNPFHAETIPDALASSKNATTTPTQTVNLLLQTITQNAFAPYVARPRRRNLQPETDNITIWLTRRHLTLEG